MNTLRKNMTDYLIKAYHSLHYPQKTDIMSKITSYTSLEC
jgi:hypothetical protein